MFCVCLVYVEDEGLMGTAWPNVSPSMFRKLV